MKYLRRFIWYLASRLLAICAIAAILIVAFYYSMNVANIQVVLKDGMSKRAQVVMMGADETELSKYFQPGFLENDSVLTLTRSGSSPYQDYNINGIDHRLSMEWMWCWPWENRARADITEQVVKIDGRIKSSLQQQAIAQGGEERLSPPKWQSAKYRATLVRDNGQWRIQALQLVEALP